MLQLQYRTGVVASLLTHMTNCSLDLNANFIFLQANTFQAVLVTDGRFSFVIFNYLDDGVNWNKGDASTAPAQVGFNYGGDGLHTLTLPDSGMENITEIDTASNVNIAGQFVFRIDDVYSSSGCSNTAGMYTQQNHICNHLRTYYYSDERICTSSMNVY